MKLLGPVALMVTELLREWSAAMLLLLLPLRTVGTAGVMGLLLLLLPLAVAAPAEGAAFPLMFLVVSVGFVLLPAALPFSGDTEAGRALLALAFAGAEVEEGVEEPVAITGVAGVLPEAPAAEA